MGQRDTLPIPRRIVDDREHDARPMRPSIDEIPAAAGDHHHVVAEASGLERGGHGFGQEFLPGDDGEQALRLRRAAVQFVERLPLDRQPFATCSIGLDGRAFETPSNAYRRRGSVIDEAAFERERSGPAVERDLFRELDGDQADPRPAGKLGCVGRPLGRFGAIPGGGAGTSGVASLQNGESEQACGRNRQYQSRIGEQFGVLRQVTRWFDEASIHVRFFLPLTLLLFYFGLSAWGWMHVYDDRRLRGAVWLCAGRIPGGIALWVR